MKYNVIYLFILPFVTIWMDLVEKEMAAHSSILAWKISWTEKTGRLQSCKNQDMTEQLSMNAQVDLEGIMVNKMSDKERQIPHCIMYM